MKRTFRSPAALAALGALAVSLAGCGGGASAPASPGFPQGQTSQTSTTNRNQPVIGKEFRSDGTSGERVAILLKGGATAANTSVLESKYGIDVQKTVLQVSGKYFHNVTWVDVAENEVHSTLGAASR